MGEVGGGASGVMSGKGGCCYAMNFLMECIKGNTMVLDKTRVKLGS